MAKFTVYGETIVYTDVEVEAEDQHEAIMKAIELSNKTSVSRGCPQMLFIPEVFNVEDWTYCVDDCELEEVRKDD